MAICTILGSFPLLGEVTIFDDWVGFANPISWTKAKMICESFFNALSYPNIITNLEMVFLPYASFFLIHFAQESPCSRE